MRGSAIRLGLIGDNIAESRAPRLHEIAGRLCGRAVTYDLLRPAGIDLSFEAVFEHCREAGYRGVNITYPYKERVVRLLEAGDPAVAAIGACNTVLFGPGGARGYNTDHTGFIAAYRNAFGGVAPGAVVLAGAGGVGRAIGFALARLGASELRLFDLEEQKAAALAKTLRAGPERPSALIRVCATIEEAADGADGFVNATPAGMGGIGGCPFPRELIGGRQWAFDAVYTPADTTFMQAARAAGLSTLSGYELFLYQGIHAFRLFAGCDVAEDRLRDELQAVAERAPA